MQAGFDAAAAGWEASRGGYRRPVLADALARGGPFGLGRAVEIASGTGLLTPLIAAVWPQVAAVDLSAGMLARSAAAGRVRADAVRLPLADGCAAAVVIGDGPLFAAETARGHGAGGGAGVVERARRRRPVLRAGRGPGRGDGSGDGPALGRGAQPGALGQLGRAPPRRLTSRSSAGAPMTTSAERALDRYRSRNAARPPASPARYRRLGISHSHGANDDSRHAYCPFLSEPRRALVMPSTTGISLPEACVRKLADHRHFCPPVSFAPRIPAHPWRVAAGRSMLSSQRYVACCGCPDWGGVCA
jgi:SAM-dependent methyltransferase